MKLDNLVYKKTARLLMAAGLDIILKDTSRPWGGFYVIDEAQAEKFVKYFFPGEDFEKLQVSGKLSPKILMVAPGKRLSWQYHFRRSEIWRCIEGEVAVVTSISDEMKEKHHLNPGDQISLQQGERHRLIGLDGWGVIAEIWLHTDAKHPSDEDDIVRLQDDFGR